MRLQPGSDRGGRRCVVVSRGRVSEPRGDEGREPGDSIQPAIKSSAAATRPASDGGRKKNDSVMQEVPALAVEAAKRSAGPARLGVG
jgi:hypothetical protein